MHDGVIEELWLNHGRKGGSDDDILERVGHLLAPVAVEALQ